MEEELFSRLVQIGTVSALDSARRMARVIFTESGHTSGWLKLLSSCGALEINDRVLVLYLPVFNGDGFVLGGI